MVDYYEILKQLSWRELWKERESEIILHPIILDLKHPRTKGVATSDVVETVSSKPRPG